MKCPNCNKELTRVNVISECWQKADVDSKGRITNHWGVEEILDTLNIECPECYADISVVIQQ